MSLLALTVSASDLPLTCQHTHRHWVSGIHFQQHITMRWTHRYRKACGFPRIYVVFQLSVIWKVFKGYSALLKNVIGYIKDAGDVILHVKVQVVGSKPTWHTSHNSRLVFFFAIIYEWSFPSVHRCQEGILWTTPVTFCFLNHSTYAVDQESTWLPWIAKQ